MTRSGSATGAESALRFPGWLLVLLVATRLALVALQPFIAAQVPEWAWANNDGYDTLAINWVDTGVYSLEPGVPTALRLPLYPALIAAAYALAGPAYPWLVMLIHAILSVWTGLLLFRMATLVFDRTCAMLAVLLFLAHPLVNNFIFRCATETLFTFLVTALAYAGVRFLRTRQSRYLAAAAVTMGLSLLVRQTLLPLAWLAWAGLAVWSLCGRREWFRRLAWTLAAGGIVAALLAPWLVRNGRAAGGAWVLQTWVGQPVCQGAYVNQHLDDFFAGRRTLTQLDQAGLFEIRQLDKRLSRGLPAGTTGIAREVAADRFFRARARVLAQRSPREFLRQTARNLLWAPVLQMTWRSTRILMWWNWPLLVFGFWGLGVCLWQKPRTILAAAPLVILPGYLAIAHALVWPQARYLLPGLVLFQVFSACGILAAVRAFRNRRKPEFHPAST